MFYTKNEYLDMITQPMYKRIRIKLLRSDGQYIMFGRGEQFSIQKDGLAGFEATDFEVTTISNAQQNGSQLAGKKIKERKLSIAGQYLIPFDSEITREQLIRFLTPLQSYTIQCNYAGVERQIEVELDGKPDYKQATLHDPLKFTVNFVAPTAMFTDINAFDQNMADFQKMIYCCGRNGFAVPATGWTGSIRKFNEITTIENNGDDDSGLQITFYAARGKVVNPMLLQLDNVTDQRVVEKIKVDVTMNQYDTLVITTSSAAGHNRIELNGQNITQKKDRESVFFLMHLGRNIIKYDADEGRENIDVHPRWKQEYLGV